MNFKSSIMRCLLVASLIVVLLLVDSSPAYARHRAGGSGGGGDIPCVPPACDPMRVEGVGEINRKMLKIQPMESAQPSLLTGVKGASSNPADIIELVNDAIDVWESAFEDSTIPIFHISVGWADLGIDDQTHTHGVIAGSLVGGMKTTEPESNLAQADLEGLIQLGLSPKTDFPSIEDEVLALHICGAPGKPESKVCSETDRTEATILFNSSPLSVHRIDEETGRSTDVPVKLFLDANPLDSAVFGPIEAIASSDPRAQQSPQLIAELPDAYVVDLFTVAMHEVGHALGYSLVNQQIKGVPASNHIGSTDMPDLLSPYAPFSTRKCPSIVDATELASVGSYVPDSQPYQLVSDNPCSAVRADLHDREAPPLNIDKPQSKQLNFGKIWKSIKRGIPIFSIAFL